MARFTRSGTVVDIVKRKIFPGTVHVANGKIEKIVEDKKVEGHGFILPGFIDSHVHIESSMLIPSEFARLATTHGTVATISDPHEIANVLGIEGIKYMIHNGKEVPFHFHFGASSCVPATEFETAGAKIDAKGIEALFKEEKLKYLSEMMNYPGVLSKNPEVMKKIEIAKKFNLPIDGHAPGLRGKEAQEYFSQGITTDHECVTLDEAVEKAKLGVNILIREGSAAKNYEALHPLIKMFPDQVMFCSDDKHPHELVKGHINELVKRSIVDHGYDVMDVLRCASLNPVKHYKLECGCLQEGDSADFIIVDDLQNFQNIETYIKGLLVAQHGKTFIEIVDAGALNNFHISPKKIEDFLIPADASKIHLIQAIDGELVTRAEQALAKIENNHYVSDVQNDILKICVVNRYDGSAPSIAFIKNFGLKKGAIASSIAHDSHNIIAVGTNDEDILSAVNLLIKNRGGISTACKEELHVLPLPVAGLMSLDEGHVVAQKYAELDKFAKNFGSKLYAPFMTLSFMALLVIPELKLSDKGLFNTKKFNLIPLQA